MAVPLTQDDENVIHEIVYPTGSAQRIIDLLNAASGSGDTGITTPKMQAWMETLPDYDPDADDQTFVRMADGTFKCVIVNHQ
jgi:hypothetical protein